jgi:hypothetical protein
MGSSLEAAKRGSALMKDKLSGEAAKLRETGDLLDNLADEELKKQNIANLTADSKLAQAAEIDPAQRAYGALTESDSGAFAKEAYQEALGEKLGLEAEATQARADALRAEENIADLKGASSNAARGADEAMASASRYSDIGKGAGAIGPALDIYEGYNRRPDAPAQTRFVDGVQNALAGEAASRSLGLMAGTAAGAAAVVAGVTSAPVVATVTGVAVIGTFVVDAGAGFLGYTPPSDYIKQPLNHAADWAREKLGTW